MINESLSINGLNLKFIFILRICCYAIKRLIDCYMELIVALDEMFKILSTYWVGIGSITGGKSRGDPTLWGVLSF